MKSVIVVGAGFSKHFANIPIVSEINAEIGTWIESDSRLKHLTALAPKRLEGERLEQWLSRLAEPDVWIHRNDRSIALLLIDEIKHRVAKLIFETQSASIPYDSPPSSKLPGDLVSLVKHWLDGGASCIVSLNYDTLIERTVNRIKNNVNGYRILHPFQIPHWAGGYETTEDLELVKPHGSIHLWNSLRDPTRVIDVGVQNGGCEAENTWWNHLYHHAPGFEPLIVPPISAKTSLLESTFLKNYWEIAGLHVKDAEEIVLIGYSLPEEDAMLTRLLQTNRNANFVVVDYNASPVSENVRKIGGKVVAEHTSETAIPDYVKSLLG